MKSQTFNEFESFLHSSLSTDLSIEIENIMNQADVQPKYKDKSVRIPMNKVSENAAPDEERVERLESQVLGLQRTLDKLIETASDDREASIIAGPSIDQVKTTPTRIRYHDPSDKIAIKLQGIMRDLDGLKQQVGLFSNTSELPPMSSPRIQIQEPEFHLASQSNIIDKEPSFNNQSSVKFIPLSVDIKEYIQTQVAVQMELYRIQIEERLSSFMIEKRHSRNHAEIKIPQKDIEKDVNRPPQLAERGKIVNVNEREKSFEDARWRCASSSPSSSNRSSSRTYDRQHLQQQAEEKRVRWEHASGHSSPISSIQGPPSPEFKRAESPECQESKDADLLLQKLRERVNQKARQLKAIENKALKQKQKSPKHLKKRVFYA